MFGFLKRQAKSDGGVCVDRPSSRPFTPKSVQEQACFEPSPMSAAEQLALLCERPLGGPAEWKGSVASVFPMHRFVAKVGQDGLPLTEEAYSDSVISGGPDSDAMEDHFTNKTVPHHDTSVHKTDVEALSQYLEGQDTGTTCQVVADDVDQFDEMKNAGVKDSRYAYVPTDLIGTTNSNSYATRIAALLGGEGFEDLLDGLAPGSDRSDAIDLIMSNTCE